MTEQEFIERIIAGDLNAMLHNLDLCIQEQAEEAAYPYDPCSPEDIAARHEVDSE